RSDDRMGPDFSSRILIFGRNFAKVAGSRCDTRDSAGYSVARKMEFLDSDLASDVPPQTRYSGACNGGRDDREDPALRPAARSQYAAAILHHAGRGVRYPFPYLRPA